ncbi:MAG: hypothetical protein HWE22_13930 [Flavobacteriales bacterium]|nr:hypothetical protein [Flavobacteriales bacterium]
MHAIEAKEQADKINSYSKDEDYVDDRVLDGIFIEIHEASKKGRYSLDYGFTAGLTAKDLRYCKEKLEEAEYHVKVDYNFGGITIDW